MKTLRPRPFASTRACPTASGTRALTSGRRPIATASSRLSFCVVPPKVPGCPEVSVFPGVTGLSDQTSDTKIPEREQVKTTRAEIIIRVGHFRPQIPIDHNQSLKAAGSDLQPIHEDPPVTSTEGAFQYLLEQGQCHSQGEGAQIAEDLAKHTLVPFHESVLCKMRDAAENLSSAITNKMPGCGLF